MRHIFRLWCAVLATLVVLAGCGGGASHHAAQHPPRVVAGHRCDPQNYAMQCALTPPAANLGRGSAPAVAYGIDFGWRSVSAATARNLGARFALSYMSNDPSKDWTLPFANSYHALGLATVATWETTATRTLSGCAGGRADALAARSRITQTLGAPALQPFTLAIDFDATPGQIDSYFRCAHQTVGDQENAYGGYFQLSYLCSHHLVGHFNFQAYAWSRGLWLPPSCAPLEQYLNGTTYDHDRAIATYYGQWPGPVKPKPKPKPGVRLAWFATGPFRAPASWGTKAHPNLPRRVYERQAVQTYLRLDAHPWRNRYALHVVRQEMLFARNRIHYLALHHPGCVNVGTCAPQWGRFHRGYRFQVMWKATRGVRPVR